ncbi:MAG: stage II sporulation protein M [Tepidibacillus sp.]
MFKLFWAAIIENKKNIKLASLIFFMSLLVGYFFIDQNNAYIQTLIKQLQNIVGEIKEKDSVFYMIYTIFVNNMRLAFLMISLGILFGIYPMFLLFMNGLFIGYILKSLLEAGQTVRFAILGILPHGILELSAIIIAAAFGMKLGFAFFHASVEVFKRQERKYNFLYLWHTIKQIFYILIGLVAILFVAAIIESTLTGYLLTNLSNLN